MKVKELIAKLKGYDDDQIVSISAPENEQGWSISDDFCVSLVRFGEDKEERVLIYLGFGVGVSGNKCAMCSVRNKTVKKYGIDEGADFSAMKSKGLAAEMYSAKYLCTGCYNITKRYYPIAAER